MRKWLGLMLSLMMLVLVVAPAAAAPAAGAFGVVLDQSGRPVAGAEIEFYELGVGLRATLTTGPDGAFRLERPVSRGTLWQLRAWARGYRTRDSRWVNLADTPYQSMSLEQINGGLQVTVRDEQGLPPAVGIATLVSSDGEMQSQARLENGRMVQPELLAGDYRVLISVPGQLPAVKSLTVAPGRITSVVVGLEKAGFTVTGELRDAVTNAPVVGAAVELQRPDQTRVIGGMTDSGGRFRLPAPQEQPGAYRLWATADGYRSALSQPLTVVRGQEFDLSGGSAMLLQPATGTIAGTLLDHWGAPSPGARVVLLLQGYGEVASVKSGSGGAFRFEKVPAGTEDRYALVSPDTSDFLLPAWFALQGGTTAQKSVQGVSGSAETVGTSSVTGVVTTPFGSPLAGATVELLRNSQLMKSALADSTGAFLINDVDATIDRQRSTNPYTLRFSKDGYVSTREFTAGGESRTDLPVTDRVRSVVLAVLRPVAADLRGRVTATDGAPVAGVQVSLRADDRTEQWTASTDAAGWYTLKEVPLLAAARYALKAEAKGHLSLGWTDVTGVAAKGQSLPTVKLPAIAATLSGQVLGPTGQGKAGVGVALQGPAGELLGQATTDDAGYYRMTADLPQTGLLTLTAAITGWTRSVIDLTDRPATGAAISRDLVIFPETATLEGRAMGPDGAPAAGVWVELLAEGKGVVDSTRSDGTGFFRFENIALSGSGWFSLRVRTLSGVTFGGSLTHRTELVPMLRLAPGERTVTDLLVTQQP